MNRNDLREVIARAICAADERNPDEMINATYRAWQNYCHGANAILSALDAAGMVVVPKESARPRIFIDCEFDGFGGELISLAMVPDDNNMPSFYQVKNIPDEPDSWVAENVIPILGKDAVGNDLFRFSLHTYLAAYKDGVEIIADWPSDVMYLLREMMGVDHSETLAINMISTIVLSLEYSSVVPHNALHDAIALRNAYRAMITVEEE